MRFGYLSSFLLVVIGVFFGFFADSLNAITLWITASLYGGYTAANVLKWCGGGLMVMVILGYVGRAIGLYCKTHLFYRLD